MSVGPAAWEVVVEHDDAATPPQSRVERLEVPSGWLYLVYSTPFGDAEPPLLCFVPYPPPPRTL